MKAQGQVPMVTRPVSVPGEYRFGGCHWRSRPPGRVVGDGMGGGGGAREGARCWGGGNYQPRPREANRLKKEGSPHGRKREWAFRTQACPQDYGGP